MVLEYMRDDIMTHFLLFVYDTEIINDKSSSENKAYDLISFHAEQR